MYLFEVPKIYHADIASGEPRKENDWIYFPLNPGYLTGILIMVYCNPDITGYFSSHINPKQPGALIFVAQLKIINLSSTTSGGRRGNWPLGIEALHNGWWQGMKNKDASQTGIAFPYVVHGIALPGMVLFPRKNSLGWICGCCGFTIHDWLSGQKKILHRSFWEDSRYSITTSPLLGVFGLRFGCNQIRENCTVLKKVPYYVILKIRELMPQDNRQ